VIQWLNVLLLVYGSRFSTDIECYRYSISFDSVGRFSVFNISRSFNMLFARSEKE